MPNANKSTGIFQSSILEDLLQFLPISCKYQKNKCPVVKDQMDILEHEKDCQFRDVLCSMQHCLSRIPVYQYKNHVVKEHHIQTNTSSEIQSKNGVYKVKARAILNNLGLGMDIREDQCLMGKKENWFFIHERHFEKHTIIWLQLFGSPYEAQNYKYSVKIDDPHIGEFFYKGPVKSLDDDKNYIYEAALGLTIPHAVIKKIILHNYITFEVRIYDLKSENTAIFSPISSEHTNSINDLIREQSPMILPPKPEEILDPESQVLRVVPVPGIPGIPKILQKSTLSTDSNKQQSFQNNKKTK